MASEKTPQRHSPSRRLEVLEQKELALVEEIERYEAEGKYSTAQEKVDELKRVRMKMGRFAESQLLAGYDTEHKAMKDRQSAELEELRVKWNAQLAEYSRQAEAIMVATQDRQKEEYAKNREEWRGKLLAKPPHYSPALLSKKRSLEILVRAKDYKQAEMVRRQVDEMIAEERNRYHEDIERTLKRRLKGLKEKQKQELEAVMQRVAMGNDDLLRQRQVELDRLDRYHRNVRHEAEQQRKVDASKTRHYLHTQQEVVSSTPRRTTVALGSVRRSPGSPATRAMAKTALTE